MAHEKPFLFNILESFILPKMPLGPSLYEIISSTLGSLSKIADTQGLTRREIFASGKAFLKTLNAGRVITASPIQLTPLASRFLHDLSSILFVSLPRIITKCHDKHLEASTI